MKQGFWYRLDYFARSLSPFAITLLLVMGSMVPMRLPDFSPIVPGLALIAVYYWSVHRPDLMPIWAAFLIGLFQDLLSGAPLGVGAMVMVIVHAVVALQRSFFSGASFILIWMTFIWVALGAHLVMWFLSCLVLDVMLDVKPAIFQFLATAAVYPCLGWLFAQAQRAFLSERRH